MNIFKSKWYICRRAGKGSKNYIVLISLGAFKTQEACSPVYFDDKRFKHKPGFEMCIPRKGAKILANPDKYSEEK